MIIHSQFGMSNDQHSGWHLADYIRTNVIPGVRSETRNQTVTDIFNSHEDAMVSALVSMWLKRGYKVHSTWYWKMQKIILNWIIDIPLWAHEMNLRVMFLSLIKNISNQGLHLTFWRKIMMTDFSYGSNWIYPLFRQASQIFRIAAHRLRPHAITCWSWASLIFSPWDILCCNVGLWPKALAIWIE